jgi:hypothetical protein
MDAYCVDRQEGPNGDHEVHRLRCKLWPSSENVQLLGLYASCDEALDAARLYHGRIGGCVMCIPSGYSESEDT